jgi:GH24 family phage-related lysozyme (muramidase)
VPIDTVIASAADAIARFEGVVTHMYLDTLSNVTVGIGELLADEAAAQALPFGVAAEDRPASAAEIAGEFAAIQAISPRGTTLDLGAAHFRPLTRLDLAEAACRARLVARLTDELHPALRAIYPGFDAFPPSAQEALLDMIYNLGAGGLVAKFPTFTREMRAGDWRDAAAQSHRAGLADTRNDYVRDCLLAAAEGSTATV